MSASERIRQWVARQFAARLVDRVTQDLIDVASGNRAGNTFERQAVARIFPGWSKR